MRRTCPSSMALACLLILLLPGAAYAWDDVVGVASVDPRLGAHVTTDGLVFGLYAPDATQVDLLLFDQPDATVARQVVPLQRAATSGGSAFGAPAARPGLLYLYRVAGPRDVSLADQLRQDVQRALSARRSVRLQDPERHASRKSSPAPRLSTSRRSMPAAARASSTTTAGPAPRPRRDRAAPT